MTPTAVLASWMPNWPSVRMTSRLGSVGITSGSLGKRGRPRGAVRGRQGKSVRKHAQIRRDRPCVSPESTNEGRFAPMGFDVAAEAYDRFMGRYSVQLSAPMADFAGVEAGQRVIDVGCGPGALTAELVRRSGAASVAAVDPS